MSAWIELQCGVRAESEDGFNLSLTTPADGFNVDFRISKEAE